MPYLQVLFCCYTASVIHSINLYNMNKKLFICSAIMIGLIVTACSKKEEQPNNNQASEQTPTQQPASEQFHSLSKAEASAVMAEGSATASTPASEPHAKHHKDHKNAEETKTAQALPDEHRETTHTSTTIHREYKEPTAQADKPAVQPVKAQTASTDAKPKYSGEGKSSKANLTEDDAVEAAMSAAKPAL